MAAITLIPGDGGDSFFDRNEAAEFDRLERELTDAVFLGSAGVESYIRRPPPRTIRFVTGHVVGLGSVQN